MANTYSTFPRSFTRFLSLGIAFGGADRRKATYLYHSVKQLVTIGLSGRVPTMSDDSAKHSKSRYLFYYMVKIGRSGSLLQRSQMISRMPINYLCDG
jgi:hypothetical protein